MNLIPKFTADEGLDEDTSMENSISDENSQAASGRDDQDGMKKTNTSGRTYCMRNCDCICLPTTRPND